MSGRDHAACEQLGSDPSAVSIKVAPRSHCAGFARICGGQPSSSGGGSGLICGRALLCQLRLQHKRCCAFDATSTEREQHERCWRPIFFCGSAGSIDTYLSFEIRRARGAPAPAP